MQLPTNAQIWLWITTHPYLFLAIAVPIILLPATWKEIKEALKKPGDLTFTISSKSLAELLDDKEAQTAQAILADIKAYRVKAEAALMLTRKGAKQVKLIGEIAQTIKEGIAYQIEQKYLPAEKVD